MKHKLNRKITIFINWLGRQDLQFLENLIQVMQETCDFVEGLFNTLNNKFWPQQNKTIKSLLYCKLNRKTCGNVK